MPSCNGLGVVDSDFTLFADLDGEFQSLTPNELGALHRNDSGFYPKFLEGCFQFLNESFLHLGFRIHHTPDQAFAKAADPLTHDITGVGDFDDQHTSCGVTKKPYPQ